MVRIRYARHLISAVFDFNEPSIVEPRCAWWDVADEILMLLAHGKDAAVATLLMLDNK